MYDTLQHLWRRGRRCCRRDRGRVLGRLWSGCILVTEGVLTLIVYVFFYLFVIGVFCFGFFPFLCFFATLIHVSLFLNSFPLDSSVASFLMKSLRSSSHSFLSPSNVPARLCR